MGNNLIKLEILMPVVLFAGIFTTFLLVKMYYQNKIKADYENLLLKLDRALGGTLSETSYDESMNSAITERLNRLIQIYQKNHEKAAKERDTIKSLVSDISHQIRTPITNIMLYTGLLAEKDLKEDAKLLTDKIQKQADKLDFFIKELVKSSYTEQEMLTLHPEMTSLEEIIDTACQITEVSAMKKQITILKETTGQMCYADKKWSIEALVNLLENSVKYSPVGSLVKITVTSYESFLCVRVIDQGIGIPEKEQGMVFERFYRSEEVKKEPGFGIGLYLVREILSKQGGYAKIKSAPQNGTTVEIYFSRYPFSTILTDSVSSPF